MKKPDKQDVKAAVVVVLTFTALIILKTGLMTLGKKTNSPLCILLDMNTGTVFTIVAFWTVILLWAVTDSAKTFFLRSAGIIPRQHGQDFAVRRSGAPAAPAFVPEHRPVRGDQNQRQKAAQSAV